MIYILIAWFTLDSKPVQVEQEFQSMEVCEEQLENIAARAAQDNSAYFGGACVEVSK
jgi:hypothetical protein